MLPPRFRQENLLNRIHPSAKADLHVHTARSDGFLEPSELVNLASERGIKILAVTDHDNMNAFSDAEYAGIAAGVSAVPGIEFSSSWEIKPGEILQIHVVGLFCDKYSPALAELIAKHSKIRCGRVKEISEKLTKHGIDAEKLRTYIAGFESKDTFVTRKHFSDYLIENGHVQNNAEAFKIYLGKGGKAYAKTVWTPMEEVVKAILMSGGIPVLAHPLHYSEVNKSNKRKRLLISEFASLGGLAIEAGWPNQTVNDAIFMRDAAKEHNLMGSLGSDFHMPGIPHRPLGCDLGICEGIEPVWEHEKFEPIWNELGVASGERSLIKKMRTF